MHQVSFDHVKKFRDNVLVLKDVSFQVNPNEKVGIIGPNGSGKSTIMKLLAGSLKMNYCAGYPYAPVPPGYDEGWVKISKGSKVDYLEQIPNYEEDYTVAQVLRLSFQKELALEKRLRDLEEEMKDLRGKDLDRILSLYGQETAAFEVAGGYEIENRINRICQGLKLSDAFLERSFSSLSGGEQTIVSLGKLLADEPDILLLDEPTNHLDLDAVEWLEQYIKDYKGIVMVVSHDRYFLDHVVTKIIEVSHGRSETYYGNYSLYLDQKAIATELHQHHYDQQQKKIQKMEATIRDMKAWATSGGNTKFHKRAASIQNKLDRMETVEKPRDAYQTIKLQLTGGDRSGKIAITAKDLCKAYGDKVLFKGASLEVRYQEKLALIGPNGSGKSTLLKMLMGQEKTDQGQIGLGAAVKTAYLPQQVVFEEEELTILACYQHETHQDEEAARRQLARFRFTGGQVYKKVHVLSGGERSRLKLAILLAEPVNLLILDEPTNHLDIPSIERIEEALEDFLGTVLIISHDRYFINRTCDELISIEEFQLKRYLGNYEFYKAQQKEEPKEEKPSKEPTKKQSKSPKNEPSKVSEADIEDLEEEILILQRKMLDDHLSLAELTSLYEDQQRLEEKRDQLLAEWARVAL